MDLDNQQGNTLEIDFDNQLYQLAYTIGLFLGDGSLSVYQKTSGTNGKRYVVFQTKFGNADIETIDRVRGQLADVFGVSYKIASTTLSSDKEFYELSSIRRIIFDFFSVNTRMKTRIPERLFGAPKEVRIELLRGILDADGWVSETSERPRPQQQWQIGFANTELVLVEGVASMLQKLGVKVGNISTKSRGGYRTIHTITPNIRSFIDAGLSFHAPRKQKKIDRYMNRVYASETLYTAPVTSGEDKVQSVVKTAE
jgi:intein-encoded DNA endonuclease-like protein